MKTISSYVNVGNFTMQTLQIIKLCIQINFNQLYNAQENSNFDVIQLKITGNRDWSNVRQFKPI